MGKNLYITTAIPYANGAPHIGNALDYLLADIWARYHRQQGREVRFQVGTDEHGNKIAAKAAEQNLEPQAYVDQMYQGFEELFKRMNTSYTDVVRTTDGHHKGAVQYIWQQLKPYIYKSTYEGWYCVGHEAFFTEKEVAETNGICPDHQAPYERISEENYFLRVSEFSDKIREAIEKDKMQIVPQYRKKEFLEMIKDGLPDVSISRPKKSLTWGVSVPGEPDQIVYVWIDALSNYLTVLGYPDRTEWQDFWPADLQVIGKDILRFHAGIWPAILLGLGLPLPKKMLVHGFIDVGGAKMSKTVGNVVSPGEIIDRYGVDACRFYLAKHVPTHDDGDFTWEKMATVYEAELANDLGNLVSRVANMLTRYEAGVIGGESSGGDHDMQPYRDSMAALEFNRALEHVWEMVRALNKYIDDVKPWQIAANREKDTDAGPHLTEVLAHCAGNLLQIAQLLVPFMPETAAKIHTTFDGGVVTPLEGVLFPRIEPTPPATKSS